MKRYCAALFVVCLIMNGCKQATSTITEQKTAISPAPSPSVVAVPTIRTSEFAISFSANSRHEKVENMTADSRGLTISAGQITAQFLSETIPVTIANAQPFLALSAKWDSIVKPATKLLVSIRGAGKENEWSEWQQSSFDGDPRTHTGLFFFPADTKFIQFKIEISRDATGFAPIVRAMFFSFISPGATPKIEREKMLALTKTEFSNSNLTLRTDWHCPDGQKPHRGAPIRTRMTHLIIHHTATSNEGMDWPAVVRCIWNFHVYTNGWSDTGYHFLIDPDGVIYEGRAGGDQVAGSHFSCANSGTLGIAMIGNFMLAQPGEPALKSLKLLLAYESIKLKINPLGSTFHASTRLNLPNISGHRAANESKAGSVCAGTHCPGDALFAMIPTIRNDVARLQNELLR